MRMRMCNVCVRERIGREIESDGESEETIRRRNLHGYENSRGRYLANLVDFGT